MYRATCPHHTRDGERGRAGLRCLWCVADSCDRLDDFTLSEPCDLQFDEELMNNAILLRPRRISCSARPLPLTALRGGVELGPVYGPTLPLEAEHPNVVIGDINANQSDLCTTSSTAYLCGQPCSHGAGKVAQGLLSLSISNSMQHIRQTAF